jgi:glycosyltransferase involved in cell wall biosynthesis
MMTDPAGGQLTDDDRVLVVRAMVGGGVQRYASDLTTALAAVEEDALPFSTIDARPPFTPGDKRSIARGVRAAKATLVHSTHLQTPRVGVPVITTVHDVIPLDRPESMPSPLRRRVFSSLLQGTLRRAVRVIAPSRLTAERLVERGADPERIRVVPEGAAPIFRPLSLEEREGARGRFSDGEPYVAAMWNARPHKNCDVLVPLASQLRSSGVRLISAGRDRPTSPAIAHAGQLGDAALRSFFGGAEAFVLPSLLEGFGLPALEAARCGTPVVCGDRVGCLDVLGEAANVVDPTLVPQLAEAVLSLLGPSRREAASAAVIAAARDASITEMATRTADVYREVLGSRAGD